MGSLRSRRVVLEGEERPATVRFAEGKIVDVGQGPADHDFGDLVVMPGLVDTHVHVNEPGRTHWEGFASATAAAVAGGTTTMVDMPLNSIPPTIDVPALGEKRQAALGRVRADVGFWGGVVPGSERQIPALVEAGVCGFKVFTVESGVDEFPPLSSAGLAAAAGRLADAGVPLLVHAEDPAALRAPDGDPAAYSTYLATRPGTGEARAIIAVAAVAEASGVLAHILHVSGAAAVEALTDASDRMTAETCPHYLTFHAGAIPDGATAFKCAPPIRSRADRESLWEALGQGTIGMVVSDHSPAPPGMKQGDFITAWGGIASLELRLPATWNGARRRGYGLVDVARWLATAPAELAGLDHRKGRIAPGLDADFVIFDPDGLTHVEGERLRQRHSLTPYDGMRLAGSVVATFLRGTQVHGAVATAGPSGQLLRRGG